MRFTDDEGKGSEWKRLLVGQPEPNVRIKILISESIIRFWMLCRLFGNLSHGGELYTNAYLSFLLFFFEKTIVRLREAVRLRCDTFTV